MVEHKRFMLFGGDNYYPSGPRDYLDSYDTLEELSEAVKYRRKTWPKLHDWYDYLDLYDDTVSSI